MENRAQSSGLSMQAHQRATRTLRELNAGLGSPDGAEDDEDAEREKQFLAAVMASSQHIEQRARDVEDIAVAMYVSV